MTAAARADALARTRTERFRADPGAVASTIATYVRQKWLLWETYCSTGLDVRLLEYEAFVQQPLATLNRILVSVGVEPFAEVPPCRYHKTTSESISTQCDNFREVTKDAEVRKELKSYDALLQKIGADGRRRWWRVPHRSDSRTGARHPR